MPIETKFYTLNQVKRMTGKSKGYLMAMIADGRLTARIFNGDTYITHKDLYNNFWKEDWICK